MSADGRGSWVDLVNHRSGENACLGSAGPARTQDKRRKEEESFHEFAISSLYSHKSHISNHSTYITLRTADFVPSAISPIFNLQSVLWFRFDLAPFLLLSETFFFGSAGGPGCNTFLPWCECDFRKFGKSHQCDLPVLPLAP